MEVPEMAEVGDTSDPSFRRTIRTLNSLEIPAWFVQQHGRNFQADVAVLGPSKQPVLVHLRFTTSEFQHRVYFSGCEWREFLLANGFKAGDDLIVTLVSKSIFTVRTVEKTTSEITNLEESDEGQSPVKPRPLHDSKRDERQPPVVIDKPWPSHDLKSDVVYARDNPWDDNLVQSVALLVSELQRPHFVVKIKQSHLREQKSCALGVPLEFYTKYASHFRGPNSFQGPSGRVMELLCPENSSRFTSGWKAFHTDNGINLGNVVVFSLCEPSKWLVQVVESRKQLEKVEAESEGDHSS